MAGFPRKKDKETAVQLESSGGLASTVSKQYSLPLFVAINKEEHNSVAIIELHTMYSVNSGKVD